MKKNKTVIFINIDGCCQDIFYDVFFSGDIPNFSSAFQSPFFVEKAISIFPTTTLPAQTSIFTGCFPKTHKIVGNSFFSRKDKIYRNYTNMHTALRVYGYKLFGLPDIILPQIKGTPLLHYDLTTSTIYEILRDNGLTCATVFSHVGKGATYWIRPNKYDMIQYALCHENYTEQFVFDKTIFKRTIEFIEGMDEIPNLLTIYLSGLDAYSHWFGPNSQIWYLINILDKEFMVFSQALKRKKSLDDIYFILSSDHGQTSIIKDKRHCLTVEKIAPYLYHSNVYSKRKDIAKCDVVCGVDGGLLLYVKNANTKRWEDIPEKTDVMKIVDDLLFSQNEIGNWIDIILIKEDSEYKVIKNEKVISSREYFANSDKYPDGSLRLENYLCERSPDIIALSNYKEGFYFGDKTYSGEHGTLTKFDSIVPFVISGPGISSNKIPSASIVDIMPTILDIFEIQANCDGKSILQIPVCKKNVPSENPKMQHQNNHKHS